MISKNLSLKVVMMRVGVHKDLRRRNTRNNTEDKRDRWHMCTYGCLLSTYLRLTSLLSSQEWPLAAMWALHDLSPCWD
jgi:hypothetical protein